MKKKKLSSLNVFGLHLQGIKAGPCYSSRFIWWINKQQVQLWPGLTASHPSTGHKPAQEGSTDTSFGNSIFESVLDYDIAHTQTHVVLWSYDWPGALRGALIELS